jgi:hypothetical protein
MCHMLLNTYKIYTRSLSVRAKYSRLCSISGSSKVKVKVTLRLTVSQSVSLCVEPHQGLMTRYLLLFDSYGLVFCGALSLTRGRVCLLYMLLTLASIVFLGGTRDHILLSQMWDFPFRRHLRLAGSRWRYSNPPPHDSTIYIVSRRIHRKHIPCWTIDLYGPHRKHLFLRCCIYSTLHSNGYYPIVACVFGRCLEMSLYVTIFVITRQKRGYQRHGIRRYGGLCEVAKGLEA